MSNANQFVCVKRPEPGLSAIFEEMYRNERLVDVILSCSDGQLQAHKLVLAASSPYFSNLFNKLQNPFHYPVIIIKDMNFEDLRLIVDFIYKGQLTLSLEKLNSLTKSAENLQINGFSTNLSGGSSSSSTSSASIIDNGTNGAQKTSTMQKLKKGKRQSTSHQQQHQYQQQQQQIIFSRSYHHQAADKLLEQSMLTGESLDGGHHQLISYNTSDPTSTKNLTNQLHAPSPSAIHLSHHHPHHHLTNTDSQHNLANQVFMGQVLSHSLAVNKTSMVQVTTNSNTNTSNSNDSNQLASSNQIRGGRVHPCNICWKTFREKANLKRHLQIHQQNRITYACPDCNKIFNWKDNYIRHTKTAHHLNNSRPQA